MRAKKLLKREIPEFRKELSDFLRCWGTEFRVEPRVGYQAAALLTVRASGKWVSICNADWPKGQYPEL